MKSQHKSPTPRGRQILRHCLLLVCWTWHVNPHLDVGLGMWLPPVREAHLLSLHRHGVQRQPLLLPLQEKVAQRALATLQVLTRGLLLSTDLHRCQIQGLLRSASHPHHLLSHCPLHSPPHKALSQSRGFPTSMICPWSWHPSAPRKSSSRLLASLTGCYTGPSEASSLTQIMTWFDL